MSADLIAALHAAGLTDTQLLYLTLYRRDKLPMHRIAEIYGVNVSTVSRTISRADRRLKRAETMNSLLGRTRGSL